MYRKYSVDSFSFNNFRTAWSLELENNGRSAINPAIPSNFFMFQIKMIMIQKNNNYAKQVGA
jgi:hypothetical protein